MRKKMPFVLGYALCGAALLRAQVKPTVPDAPTFPKGTPTVLVPYTHEQNPHRMGMISVRLSIHGGEPHGFDVDTGSIGIVVSAADIPNFDGKGEPGDITYSSSGIHLMGVWTTVDVTFPDAKTSDGKPVVAHLPVLAVNKRECLGTGVNARKCTPGVPETHMLGIGFGRGHSSAYDLQRKNAFLMLDAMQQGKMRRGYIITPQGIQLGLNDETVQGPWIWQKLKLRNNPPADYTGPFDYETTPGSFAVNGAQMPMGSILMDTGLTNMMLRGPRTPKQSDLPAGTTVKIELLGGKTGYEFRVGDSANPAAPRKTSWVDPNDEVYVNTGAHALSLFDYCYDADGGYLGLRKRQ